MSELMLILFFYYVFTAMACVWFSRIVLTNSVRNFLFRGLFPFIGGTVLLVMFFQTAIDSIDPSYGSGTSLGGIGMVFILGMGVLLLGVVLMVWTRLVHPAFFTGKTLPKTTSITDDTTTIPIV